jgi:hypothetical protein
MTAAIVSRSKVAARADAVLDYLVEHGPAVLTKIAAALVLAVYLVRFALVTLRSQNRAHIKEFARLPSGKDGMLQYTAIYAAGPGEDAVLPYKLQSEGLDFKSTKHLQGIYHQWASTRFVPESTDE